MAVVVVGSLGAWYFYSKGQNSSTTATTSTTPTPTGATQNPPSTAAAVTITFTSAGFSPTTVTVQSGGKLTVINNSSGAISFNSNPHPTHIDNSELNIGTIGPGESKTVTLTKTGTWGYHNHLNPSQGGTIIVQ